MPDLENQEGQVKSSFMACPLFPPFQCYHGPLHPPATCLEFSVTKPSGHNTPVTRRSIHGMA